MTNVLDILRAARANRQPRTAKHQAHAQAIAEAIALLSR
jgi:hypothetical protein